MSIFSKYLSQRNKLLLGITTLKGRHSHKLYWACFAAALVLLLLPWTGVVAGMIATYLSLALGDEVQIPLWAWIAVVVMPLVAVVLAKMMAGRISTQWYLRSHAGQSE